MNKIYKTFSAQNLQKSFSLDQSFDTNHYYILHMKHTIQEQVQLGVPRSEMQDELDWQLNC